MNLYVIVCGATDFLVPDIYGPFFDFTEAQTYLDGHVGKTDDVLGNPKVCCLDEVHPLDHSIVMMFR